MGCLGNILWFLLGGMWQGLAWCLAGALWCITVVGIPIGLQCFKFAGLSFFPFGKEVVYGGGAASLLLNLVWLLVAASPWPWQPPSTACFCASPSWASPSGCSASNWPSWL